MSSPQNKRGAAQLDHGEHTNASKKTRALAIGNGEVKQEQLGQGGEEEGAGQGRQGEQGALVPVLQAMEEPQFNFRMPVSRVHCHNCVRPLKPPTYKCEASHVVCADCRGSHVKACAAAAAGSYVHCAELDGIVGDIKVPCAYEAHGCPSWVVYYDAPNHHRSCRFPPCFCPYPGCRRFTSPEWLAEHFSADHDWPVTEVEYAKPCKLAVPGPQDKLLLVGKADGSVFLVSPSALGAASTAVSLVCVRACGDAATGAPQYRCKLWAEVAGNKENLALAASMVASSDMASGFPPTEQGMFLAVPPPLLHDESGEPPALMVRIDKVGESAVRSRSPSVATPPSSVPRRMLQ